MRAKPSAAPAKAPISAPAAQSLHFIPEALLALLVENKPAMTAPLFFASPLPIVSNFPSVANAVAVVFSNSAVQRAASECRCKLIELTERAAYRSEISGAIGNAMGAEQNLANISVPAALAALAVRDEALSNALASVREDHAAHDRAHALCLERARPLNMAVSELSVRAAMERDSLLMHIAGSSRDVGGPGGVAKQRFDSLVAGGLSPAKINELGFPLDDRAQKAEEMRARLPIVMGILAQCTAFSSDPYRGVQHLEGLGLDDAIAAHEAAFAVVA
jgi:hypothetical protein